MGAKFIRYAMFLRQQLEAREIGVRDLYYLCGEEIHLKRFYRFLSGDRLPTYEEGRLIEQRLGVNAPPKFLKGEDREGRVIKDRQLALPGLREARR